MEIESMSMAQIQQYIAAFNESFEAEFTELNNEVDFSDDDLMNIMVGIDALAISGTVENARHIYSRLYYGAAGELQRRMGALPYVEDDND